MTNEQKNPIRSAGETKPRDLSKDELKSATGGADCTKGPDGVSFQKVRNKQPGTHGSKRPTRP